MKTRVSKGKFIVNYLRNLPLNCVNYKQFPSLYESRYNKFYISKIINTLFLKTLKYLENEVNFKYKDIIYFIF